MNSNAVLYQSEAAPIGVSIMSRIDSTSSRPQLTTSFLINTACEQLLSTYRLRPLPTEHVEIVKHSACVSYSITRKKMRQAEHNVSTGVMCLYDDRDIRNTNPGLFIVNSLILNCGHEQVKYSLKGCDYANCPELNMFHPTPFKQKIVGKYNLLVQSTPNIPVTVYDSSARYNCLKWHAKNEQILGTHKQLNLNLLPNYENLFIIVPNEVLMYYTKRDEKYKLFQYDLYTNVYSHKELIALFETLVEPRFLKQVEAQSCFQLTELERYTHLGSFVILTPAEHVVHFTTSDIATMALQRSLKICNT